jgi:hypothetical protein
MADKLARLFLWRAVIGDNEYFVVPFRPAKEG